MKTHSWNSPDLADLKELLFRDAECLGHCPEPGVDADEQRTVYCDGSCRASPSPLNHHANVYAAVLAMARRDWAVRVLDVSGQLHVCFDTPNGNVGCRIGEGIGTQITLDTYIRGSRDAARLVAALAVFPSLDRNAPNWPGECP